MSFSPHNWGKWGEIAGDASSSSLLPPKERARGCRGGKKLSKLEEGGRAGERERGVVRKLGLQKREKKGSSFPFSFRPSVGYFSPHVVKRILGLPLSHSAVLFPASNAK